jgi:hypothetical protein
VTRAALSLALALAACNTPTPQLTLALAGAGPSSCPDDCAKLPLPCDAVVSIRILDPHDPNDTEHPEVIHLTQCERVRMNMKNDVCALNQTNLADVPLPVHDLEIQVAVFPGSAVPTDPATGALMCPEVSYSQASGFPVTQAPAPALGGQAFYHPGDSQVKVTLGCSDLSAMQAGDSCSAPGRAAVAATVDDFDTRVPVAAGATGVARRLFVSVGEPQLFDGGYVLDPTDVTPLRLDDDDIPRWTSPEAPALSSYGCVEVLEDAPGAVGTLRCLLASDLPDELVGMWLSRERLQGILSALGATAFPDEGITIGMVVDATAGGAPNYTIQPSGGGSVVYVAKDGIVGGSATSETGIFASRDAPFGTMFTASGAKRTVPAVGGLVAGKVTLVIVPFASMP